MNHPVVIFGASGLGKVALDIFKSNDIVVYCFLDDDTRLHNTEIEGISVMGSTDNEEILKILDKHTDAFVATDDNKLRKGLVRQLMTQKKKMPVNAIHQKAWVEPSAHIAHGNLIGAGAVVASHAKVHNHCIINAGAIIDYQAEIADFVQVGAGSVIGAGASVGEGAFIGSGVTIVPGIKIGKNARIGAGSVVIKEVAEGETVFGVPAQKV